VQFAAGIFAGILIGGWYAATHRHRVAETAAEIMGKATILGAAVGMVASGAIVYWLARRMIRRNAGLSLASLGWGPSTPRFLLGAAFFGAAVGILFLAFTIAVPMPQDAKAGQIARVIAHGGWPLYLWALLALVIAPPVEEFVFRGMLWTGFSQSWGPVASGIAATVAFVALHIPEAGSYPPALVSITIMGVGALAARIVSGSLVPAILLHATYNTILVVATLGSYA